jgi:hypothetical protein
MLPCYYLWCWLANQIDQYVTKDNPYRFWVDWNLSTDTSYAIGNYLHSWSVLYPDEPNKWNELTAMEQYTKSMDFELLDFKDAVPTGGSKLELLFNRK